MSESEKTQEPQFQGQYQPGYPPQPQYCQQSMPAQQPVTVNVVNSNTNTNVNGIGCDERDRKSKWIALVLCILLGYFGVHNFYCGKTGLGLLYLFTFGLFGIGWVIDIFRILFGSYRDKWGRALRS